MTCHTATLIDVLRRAREQARAEHTDLAIVLHPLSTGFSYRVVRVHCARAHGRIAATITARGRVRAYLAGESANG